MGRSKSFSLSQHTHIERPLNENQIYDTDGNFLTALDSFKMQDLLPQFLDLVKGQNRNRSEPLKLIDLGCGTGRNTQSLRAAAPAQTEIVGLDASPDMLDVARSAMNRGMPGSDHVSLEIYDLDTSAPPSCVCNATGVISTLVLEHIALARFFECVSAMLQPGGYLLVTNMHPDLGALSQAGFIDPETGTMVRPTSYCHTVADVLESAEKAGFEAVEVGGEKVREGAVDEDLAADFERARKYLGVHVWFGICFRKCN